MTHKQWKRLNWKRTSCSWRIPRDWQRQRACSSPSAGSPSRWASPSPTRSALQQRHTGGTGDFSVIHANMSTVSLFSSASYCSSSSWFSRFTYPSHLSHALHVLRGPLSEKQIDFEHASLSGTVNESLAERRLLSIRQSAHVHLGYETVWRLTVRREGIRHIVVVPSQFLVTLHDLLDHFVREGLRSRGKASETNGAGSDLRASRLLRNALRHGSKSEQVFLRAFSSID